MMRAGGEPNSVSKSHHPLGNAYTQKQNRYVISLLHTFEKQSVSLSPSEDKGLLFCNTVAGQVFSNAIYENLICAYDTGQRLYQDFVKEQLKPGRKIQIFAQLKKAMIKTCKSSNKRVKIKHKDKIATLKEENIIISRVAMICGSRDLGTKHNIGNHKLKPFILSLMRREGTFLDGWEGKTGLAARVLGGANITIFQDIPYKSEHIAIDAMYIMHHIWNKKLWVNKGSDLTSEFCICVDQSEGAKIVLIGFECYSDISLKFKAWKLGKEKGKIKNQIQI